MGAGCTVPSESSLGPCRPPTSCEQPSPLHIAAGSLQMVFAETDCVKLCTVDETACRILMIGATAHEHVSKVSGAERCACSQAVVTQPGCSGVVLLRVCLASSTVFFHAVRGLEYVGSVRHAGRFACFVRAVNFHGLSHGRGLCRWVRLLRCHSRFLLLWLLFLESVLPGFCP